MDTAPHDPPAADAASQRRPEDDTAVSGIASIVHRCLAGDQAAMHDLVEHYQCRVYALCYRMLGQREDAEDAAQETFVRVLRNLTKWDATRDFEPWLFTIAANRCRTALATRARKPRGVSIDQPVPDHRPERHAADGLAEELALALATLRDHHRTAFVLFHEQELSYEEIALALNCPLGTVKTWIHRARTELIRCLRNRDVIQGGAAADDASPSRVSQRGPRQAESV